jgi:hypothetical protein
MAYAENTEVSVAKSKAEIEDLVVKYGASQFASGFDIATSRAVVSFVVRGRMVRFVLPVPSASSPEVKFKIHQRSHKQVERPAEEIPAAMEKLSRRLYRALALCIKAKLEAVASSITTFDDEFLAHIVDPRTNRTVGELIRPQLDKLSSDYEMPGLLEYGGADN